MKNFIILFVLSLICIGCRTPIMTAGESDRWQRLQNITLSDGVSRPEAETIAQSYFAKNVGCGSFGGIQDGGDRWTVDVDFEYAGMPIKGFYIDKQLGVVTSPVGPSYNNPFKILP